MVFLIGATVAASLVMAAADAVPAFDTGPSCRAAASHSNVPDRVSACRQDEQSARDRLTQAWTQFGAADKAQCVSLSRLGGKPTYTELLSCLEMSRDAHNLRREPASPATTSQRLK